MAKGDPMPYRVQRVRCRLCGDIVEFGEGTEVSPLELSGGEFTWCYCGAVSVWPYEPDPHRIDVDPPHTMDIVEDLSVLWKDAPPMEPTGSFIRHSQFTGHPFVCTYYTDLAPWDGRCRKCRKPVTEGSEFVRIDVPGREAGWYHPICAEPIMREE